MEGGGRIQSFKAPRLYADLHRKPLSVLRFVLDARRGGRKGGGSLRYPADCGLEVSE